MASQPCVPIPIPIPSLVIDTNEEDGANKINIIITSNTDEMTAAAAETITLPAKSFVRKIPSQAPPDTPMSPLMLPPSGHKK